MELSNQFNTTNGKPWLCTFTNFDNSFGTSDQGQALVGRWAAIVTSKTFSEMLLHSQINGVPGLCVCVVQGLCSAIVDLTVYSWVMQHDMGRADTVYIVLIKCYVAKPN